MEAYVIHVVTLAAIFLIATLAFNLQTGWAGMLSLGHAAMMGVGGYTLALLLRHTDAPYFIALLAGVCLAGALSAGFSVLSRKITSHTYSVLTLWFGFVIAAVLMNWRELTRGALGIPGIARPAGFAEEFPFLLLVLTITTLVYLVVDRLTRSPWGRALGAMRDDEVAATTLGKNVVAMKITVSAIAGGIAGLSGALLASFLRFIDPGTFGLPLLVLLLVFLVVGGLASLPGTVLGVVSLLAVREGLRFLPFSPELVGAFREIVFAGALLLVILYRPKGLLGKVELE